MKVLDMDGSGWAANLVGSAIIATVGLGVAGGAELLFGATFGIHFHYGWLWVGFFVGQVLIGWLARADWDQEPPAQEPP